MAHADERLQTSSFDLEGSKERNQQCNLKSFRNMAFRQEISRLQRVGVAGWVRLETVLVKRDYLRAGDLLNSGRTFLSGSSGRDDYA